MNMALIVHRAQDQLVVLTPIRTVCPYAIIHVIAQHIEQPQRVVNFSRADLEFTD